MYARTTTLNCECNDNSMAVLMTKITQMLKIAQNAPNVKITRNDPNVKDNPNEKGDPILFYLRTANLKLKKKKLAIDPPFFVTSCYNV